MKTSRLNITTSVSIVILPKKDQPQMKTMNDLNSMLFAIPGSFKEKDYLTFLSQRVPPDLTIQLISDGGIDLALSKDCGTDIDVSDLVIPLLNLSFRAKRPTVNILSIASILNHIMIGYGINLREDPKSENPYKVIYIASFNLYGHLNISSCQCGYLNALDLLMIACDKLDFESRLQVCRFLGSLIPSLGLEKKHEPAPISATIIAISIILSNVINDLSLLAEHTMPKEQIGKAWKEKSEKKRHPYYDTITFLKRSVSDFFGPSGKMRNIADRFLPVIEKGKIKGSKVEKKRRKGDIKGTSLISANNKIKKINPSGK